MTSNLLNPSDIAERLRERKNERPRARRTNTKHAFQAKASTQLQTHQKEGLGIKLQPLYLGVAFVQQSDKSIDIGFASHDGTYSIDFAVQTFGQHDSGSGFTSGTATPAERAVSPRRPGTPASHENNAAAIADHVIASIRKYQEEHMYKFIGAGVSKTAFNISPQLPARMWAELDIVALVFDNKIDLPGLPLSQAHEPTVDEIADSQARKALQFFGPTLQPRVTVGYRNQVEVDCSGHVQISSLEQYQASAGQRTWDAVMKYAKSIKDREVKIAFFNSTPQGGGVALMRHALIRYFRLIGVDARWFVPKPKPEVFRITKTNHNILQGVADAKERLHESQKQILDDWCNNNAELFWTREGGPLAPRSRGGVDVVIVDDPQMPKLVQIAKEQDPDRPVIFRSHIQVRADLADKPGTPTSEVWNWVWGHVQKADVFISHPVREFVPATTDFDKVGYMPATTDWLDGLNKQMSDWDLKHYMHEFDMQCITNGQSRLAYPKREYIVQIARFDPAKGIPDVLAAYAKLRREHMKDRAEQDTPQLVIAGHGAIDDPDAATIMEQTFDALKTEYKDLASDIVVMRLGPTDQILNALMSCAHVALQLSTREGFEVKVSEALHKGTPTIATKAGGIPLQVQHDKSGFLVEPGDSDAVAKYLNLLFEDTQKYDQMAEFAAHHVSDEVHTVGNALCWLYLADVLSQGKELKPKSAWINDMAREQAGLPYEEGEARLPREKKLDLTQ